MPADNGQTQPIAVDPLGVLMQLETQFRAFLTRESRPHVHHALEMFIVKVAEARMWLVEVEGRAGGIVAPR